LLNQKNGKSFVIFPEFVAPCPFLYGTMCKSELTITGPVEKELYQIRVNGVVLPSALQFILNHAFCEDDNFKFSPNEDLRLTPLNSIPFDN